MCNCGNSPSSYATINWTEVQKYQASASRALATRAADSDARHSLTVSANGDHFATSSAVVDGTLQIELQGNILSFDVDLTVSATLNNGELDLVLQVKKPIALGPYTFKFNVGQPGVASATSSGVEATSASSGGFPCIVKCLGQLAPVFAECIGDVLDPAAFLACLGEKLPSHLGELVPCILKCI